MRRTALAVAVLVIASCAGACRVAPDRARQFDAASATLWRGQIAEARALAEEGLAASEAQPDSLWTWKFRLLRAEIALVGGQPAEAAAALAATIADRPELAWVRAKQQYLNAQFQITQGRSPEALATLDEAKRLADAAAAADVSLDVEILRGQAYSRLGRWRDADQHLLGLAERAHQLHDAYREAVVLVNLGMGRLVRNRFDEALVFFERVIAARDLFDRLVYARALINAGICYARLGDFDRSLALLEQAVRGHEERGTPTYLAQALGELGNTHLQRGAIAQGISYLTRAFEVASSARLNADAAVSATNLAAAFIDVGRWDEATRWNDESRLRRGDARPRPYHLVNQAKIAFGRGRVEEAVRLFGAARETGQNDPAIQWQAHAGLGRALAARGDRRAAATHFEAAVAVIERTRSELLKADYKLSLLPRLMNFYREYIEFLVDERQVERALIVANSSRARVLAERHGLEAPARSTTVAFRRAAAQLASAVVFYWIGPEKSYAWIVTERGVQFVPLAARDRDVQDLVRAHHAQIVTSLGDPRAASGVAGDTLYATLVAPIAASIPRGSRVLIVPDGALNMLNFETLPVPGTPRRYWIEDVEIAVAPSLGVLAAADRGNESRQPSVLLVGDPIAADPQYPQLRYASAEIAAVSNAFPGRASVYRADQATPLRYRSVNPNQFDIVHFAAHAAANAESPLDSAVVLSRDGSGYKLYARDVAEQPLSAELVTISACRSAGERAYAGEGLVGFAWAFLRAGARRVIAGLWDVDDRSTAALMGRLYALIAEGHTPAGALRAAKLEMIASGSALAKPYYWAPFQVFVGAQVTP